MTQPQKIKRTSAASPTAVSPAFIEAALFEFLMAILLLGGMFGCLITGFSLAVIPSVLYIGIPAAAAVQILLGRLSRPIISAGIQLSVLGIWAWLRYDILKEGLLYLTAAVLRFLCWGFPGLTMPPALSEYELFLEHAGTNDLLLTAIRAPQTECILFLSVLSGLLWYILYRRCHRVWLSAALPLPAFILCFLIIDTTVPARWALLLILLYWALLLFTRAAVRLHTRAASAQAAFLLIPLALFLFAVYRWYPRQTPVGDLVQNGYDKVLNAVSVLESAVSDAAGGLFSGQLFTVSAEGNEIAFDSLNPRRFLGRTVMRAKCDTTGVIYLRENTYGRFTEEGWEQTVFDGVHAAEPEPDFQMASASILAASGVSPSRLSLDGARSPLLFTPYYFSDSSASYAYDGDSRITNPDRTSDYDVAFYRFSGNFDSLQHNEAAGASMMLTWYMQKTVPAYREIDGALAEELRTLLMENNVTDSSVFEHSYVMEDGSLRTYTDYDTMWQTVSDITYFVRSCAKYSLNADKNTTGRNFVLWFLEDAEYGYCTHFATAEVMLLRACGIPARLAAGYLGSIRTPNTWTAVKDSNAHAWAEVFDFRLGWVPIEATPPTELSEDMNPDHIIVGMTPIPTDNRDAETAADTDTEQTEAPTDTAPVTEEPPAQNTEPQTPPDDSPPQNSPPDDSGHGGGSGEGGGGGSSSALPQILRAAAVLLSALAAVTGTVLLLRFYRQVRRRRIAALFTPDEADRNVCALRLYRRCTSAARACREKVPEQLTAIAEKARFSQHILTQEELDTLRIWYESRCAALQKNDKPLPHLRHYWIDLYY